MSTHHSLIAFTPAEAGEISGLTPGMQRDWRRRGFLPAADGHARYNAFDVTDMRTLKLLSDGGLGPAAGSRLWKRAVAYCVVSRALKSPQAYSIAPSDLNGVRRTIIDQAIREETYTGQHLPAGISNLIFEAPRFAVWWGTEAASVGNSLDQLHRDRAVPGMPTHPGVFLDIYGAADDLLRLAGFLVGSKD